MYIKHSDFQWFLLFILWHELKTAASLFFAPKPIWIIVFEHFCLHHRPKHPMIFQNQIILMHRVDVEMELELQTYMYNICYTKLSHWLDFLFYLLKNLYVYLLVTGTLFPQTSFIYVFFCIVWYSETVSVPASETLACMLQ